MAHSIPGSLVAGAMGPPLTYPLPVLPSARASQSFVIPVDLSTYLERLRAHLSFPRRSMSDVADLSSATDSDTSGVSFQPDIDATDDSDSRQASNSTELTTPEPTYLPDNCSRPSTRPKRPMRRPADAGILPDFSDNPDDNTDEDIANVPLNYRRSEQTKVRGRQIEKRWDKYCRVKAAQAGALLKWDDPVEALREVTPNNVYRFFNYCMKLKYSEGGRHLKGISKASALKADWKGFRGYYRRITRTRITAEDSEEINAGIRKLVDKFDLDTQERGKEPVYVQDLTELNETILRTQERRFHFGYERIQLCLFNMLGIYTMNRLHALLSLQFHHLRFSVQDNPDGGPPVLLVEIKSEHTKRFLGTSQINNFPFPEIINDPSLIFSPYTFIFGILLWLQAFEVPTLSSIERLRKLFVQGGRQQMELPLKREVEGYYVFCKTDNVMNGRESNKSLMRAITRISRWIDKRRPRHLTSEQRASLREHPEYVEATRRMKEQAEECKCDPSAAMQSRLEKLKRETSNTFGRLERALRRKVRHEFDRKQAIIDIERQLSGAAVDDEEAKKVLQVEDQMLPEQIDLLEKLFTWPTSQSLEAEWQRRNATVATISRYCGFLEGGPLRGRRKRAVPSDGFDEEQTSVLPEPAKKSCSSPEPSQQDILLVKAGNYIKKAKKPRRCFQCYGDTELPIHRRTQKYSEYKSTLRHFREKHL
ncbi:hypothetical protein CBS147354_9889 [Penicillium roqueforti]|nr:hypothetical protein CBS147354_9889 [Penicillium roqueforti]